MAERNKVSLERKKVQNPRVQTHIVRPQSRNVIAVGCKLQNGMHLDIRQIGEPTERVTLKGINSLSAGQLIRVSIRGGYAVTENVPKEFFERWMELNRNHPVVVNELIFAHEELASVRDMAEDRDEILNGVEPIDPNKKIKGPDGKVQIETRKDDDD